MNELLSASNIRKSQVEFLVQSETDSELQSNFEQIEEWVDDDVLEWKPIGGVVNTDVFGNLTDSFTALVENITNASDAYLLQNYDGGEYRNCFEAADSVLDLSDHTIQMRFDGDKPTGSGEGISITFSDSAHGQPTDNFDVFVSPLEAGLSKQEHSFLQGCRGVGSITALGHTENGYKFIASASDEDPESWTWTLIRPGEGSGYYYLTVNGEFPTFEGEFDCGEGIGRKSHGTVVKLYNYELPSNPIDAANGSVFKRELSRYIPEPVIPVEIYDSRYDGSEATFTGIGDEIESHSELFHTEEIETEVFGVGEVKVDVYVGYPEEEREERATENTDETLVESLSRFFASNTNKHGLVCVNGQTHKAYTRSELSNLTEFSSVTENMLVVAHILENQNTVGESLFNSGRTGFTDETAKKRIESTVFGTVGEQNTVQSVNELFEESEEANDVEQSDSPQELPEFLDVTENEDGSFSVSVSESTETEVTIPEPTTDTTNSEDETADSVDVDAETLVLDALESIELDFKTADTAVDAVFSEMVSAYESTTEKDMSDFQSVASSVGAVFEVYVEELIESLSETITVERDVVLEDAAMVGTGSADAVLYGENGEMLAIVELKGNPKEYTNKDGEVIHTASCSGLERSDTVKKAVCQAYQSNRGYPDVPFVLMSNTLPSTGSSPEKVLSFAEDDLIEEVVDVTDGSQLQTFLESIES